MAKQDTWTRVTLRIPQELHAKLTDAAAEKSLNAEIIARLEDSFTDRRALPQELAERIAAFNALESIGSETDALAFLVEQGLGRVEDTAMVVARIDQLLSSGDNILEATRKVLFGDPRLVSMSVSSSQLVFRFANDQRPITITDSGHLRPSAHEVMQLTQAISEGSVLTSIDPKEAKDLVCDLATKGHSLNWIKFKIGFSDKTEKHS